MCHAVRQSADDFLVPNESTIEEPPRQNAQAPQLRASTAASALEMTFSETTLAITSAYNLPATCT